MEVVIKSGAGGIGLGVGVESTWGTGSGTYQHPFLGLVEAVMRFCVGGYVKF